MEKSEFLDRNGIDGLRRVMEAKGYAFFSSGLYNLNIVGIRSDEGGKVTNKFDDVMAVVYRDEKGEKLKLYRITTEPGAWYMKNLGNPKGTAILVPGQYRGCWMIGKHNGKYDALVQCKAVKVYRDGNRDMVYDMLPGKTDEGLFGINIHRSSPYSASATVDNWSAGCQVFADPKEFKEFMGLCEEQRKRYSNRFSYTLLDEKDFSK